MNKTEKTAFDSYLKLYGEQTIRDGFKRRFPDLEMSEREFSIAFYTPSNYRQLVVLHGVKALVAYNTEHATMPLTLADVKSWIVLHTVSGELVP